MRPAPIVALGCLVLALAAGAGFPPQAAPAESPPDPSLVEDLAYANRILYDQGVLDGFGHVSVRDSGNPGRFLMSRSMAPALVTPRDILSYDLQGNPINAGDRRVYVERFIHAAIYRARPDVQAIVHTHAPALIPFGVTGAPLRPIYHMSAFLGAGAPVFEIRGVAGESDMLVASNEIADALARTLGDRAVALMRGHGAVVVGASLPQAVVRSVYAEVNARLQAEAMRLGTVTYLSEQEAARAASAIDQQVSRPWELWKARIGRIE